MKTIYLTFDDGPSAEYTPKLLELLEQYQVKATFFAVGEFAASNEAIVRSMLGRGHSVQLHANRHVSALTQRRVTLYKDMEAALDTLERLGAKPTLYRPPWGHTRSFSNQMAKDHGLRLVKWDVMAQDWKAKISSEEIARRVLDRTSLGSVICLHDGRGSNNAPARTIEALKIAIPELIERGYSFEIMG